LRDEDRLAISVRHSELRLIDPPLILCSVTECALCAVIDEEKADCPVSRKVVNHAFDGNLHVVDSRNLYSLGIRCGAGKENSPYVPWSRDGHAVHDCLSWKALPSSSSFVVLFFAPVVTPRHKNTKSADCRIDEE